MNYTRLQRSIASFVLPFFFFWLVFRFPFDDFFSWTEATNPEVNSLVSILVSEDVYSWVESSVKRYAEDIQNQLQGTRAVIIPVPDDATSFEIAALNENLYYEWYKWLTGENSFESQLVWSVFIWNIPSPIVFEWDKSSKTIFPYIDFEDKKYVYNHQSDKYESNTNNIEWLNAEVWHGLIVPNKDSIEDDIDAINDYFDKNHDFYQWEGNFTYLKWTINWKTWEEVSESYEPYVFYFDQFREQASLDYSKFQWYEAYLENREDLNYSRYSKELAQKIQDRVLWSQSDQIDSLISDLDPEITDLSLLEDFTSQGPDISNTSAISTRFITNNVTKQFLETLNSSTLWEFRKEVYNAWRYNWVWSEVNVDTIAYLISVLDTLWDSVIKWVNNNLEKEIDSLVIDWGLSRKIAVPVWISTSGSSWFWSSCSTRRYTNFLYWKHGSEIQTASDCSIYLWSTENGWTLVEANRWYNVEHVESDIAVCRAIWTSSIWKTQGYWGGNSPLNFSDSSYDSWVLALKSSNLKWAIAPLFDIKWSIKTTDSSKIPSPLNCYDNNYFLSYSEKQVSFWWGDDEYTQCVPGYRLPIDWNDALEWKCWDTNKSFSFDLNFTENFDRITPSTLWSTCDILSVSLDWNVVKSVQWSWTPFNEEDSCSPKRTSYTYKTIPSHIEHKSATASELWDQTDAMITPNLPIVKDRYIDFIWAGWDYDKIKYPYLYRFWEGVEYTWDFSEDFEMIKDVIDSKINEKNTEINNIINRNSPSWLSGWDLDKYNRYFKKGVYPNANFDLAEFLPKDDNDFTKDWDTKSISYYDTLAFAIYWSNLDSVSQKYKFIIENYLSDQFQSDDSFSLAKHKKSYEIAYLWAPWDAQNMYVTLDPENKWVNPYADIVSDNLLVNSDLMSANLALINDAITWEEEWKTSCAPPEWVPLWEWIPAVVCWMEDILPPKISVWKSTCSTKTLFDDSDEWIYDFGQNDSDIEAWYCSTDITLNGISDCLEEEIENATLKLKASTQKAWYWEGITIETWLFDSSDIAIEWVNFISTTFELVSISAPVDETEDFNELNSKEVYNVERLNEKSLLEASRYISFNDTEIPLSSWKAKYNFSAKNKDADVYIRSRFSLLDNNGVLIKELSSDDIKIEIRETTFSLSSRIINDWWNIVTWNLWVLANNETNIFFHDENVDSLDSLSSRIANSWTAVEKIVMSLSHFDKAWKVPVAYPLTVKYLYNWEQLFEDEQITDLSGIGFSKLKAFTQSWLYTIEIEDSEWKTVSNDFTVLADSVSDIEINLWSSDIESDWNITNNILILKDQYDNIVQWQPYTVSMELLSWGLVFPNDWDEATSTKTLTVYQWLQVFRLKPTGSSTINKLNVVVNSWDAVIREVATIVTHDSIESTISTPDELVVWWNEATFTLTFNDANGNPLNEFNSRAYVDINALYGSVSTSYVEIVNGVAEVTLKTSNVSWEDIPLEFSVEWLWETIRKNISILPGVPMKIDMVLSQSKMEASPESSGTLRVELKDRYNNLVTNDSTTSFNIEVNEDSQNILSSWTATEIAQKWEATFNLSASSNPWTAYIKVTSTPDLNENTFVVGTWDSAIEVRWVWVNATQVKTFYFWNKKHIEWNNFNGLYSVLLGAEYWDYTQKDYLAWSLLFDKNNRSLAVTSLLNNPHGFADSLVFWKNGWIQKQSSDWDLSQDISLSVELDVNNKLYIDVNNEAINTYVWKIHYNFSENTLLKTCVSDWVDFTNCGNDVENTSITLKSLSDSYSVSSLDSELIFSEVGGNTLLKIADDKSFIINPLVELEIDTTDTDSLVLNILSGDTVIWKLAINFKWQEYFVTRTEIETKTKKLVNKNSIIAEFKSYTYGSRNTYLSDGSKTLAIYYNDPFRDQTALDSFSSNSLSWLENFENEWWIWWEGDNKILLSFAAWKTVWESVKDYTSFSTINLWDPVIWLKKITETFNDWTTKKSFDSTIGKLLSSDTISSYQTFDYNNDNNTDILLIKNDWYIKLLENRWSWAGFLDKWELVYMADFWKASYVKAWDFSWDWYWDIFFVNSKWEPFLFENNQKDFERIPLTETFDLNAKIVQVEIFNMDNDVEWKQDLVTLDDAGNITIFYWNSASSETSFTKNEISSWYWMTLNWDARTDWALVYFDWLVQINEQDLLDTLALENDELAENPTGNNDSLIDWIIFEKVNYSTWLNSEISLESNVINSLPELTWTELWTSSADTAEALSWFLSTYWDSTTIQGTNAVDSTTFIKSEYAQAAWIQVEKRFEDINAENLQSGDLVEVTVTLTNTSGTTKSWIAYVDSIVSPFEMTQVWVITDEGIIERWAPAWYNLLLDEITLDSWESTVINYTLRVLPITFGHIKVWLFEEEWTVWDDLYWDIIIKDDNKNCSQAVDMFRSLTSNTYSEKEETYPRCDEDKLTLPDELEKNKIDSDNNGVPDYIDAITNSVTAQKEFAAEALEEMQLDTDWDWVPDEEDPTPNFNADELWGILDPINEKVDDITEGIDTMIEWFGCWFWWDSCYSTPLNWAPLAPWQDPTVFGNPVWDWLKVWEWTPIFSAFTWQAVPVTWWCIEVPSFWPRNSSTFDWACWWASAAWGAKWINSPTNFVRLFATPTITGWAWFAACFGWPASVAGNSIPKWVSPLVPGWNCIVYAKPLLMCSNDWSEWDPESLWLATQFGWVNSFWVVNANCSVVTQWWDWSTYGSNASVSDDFATSYYEYKESEFKSEAFSNLYDEALAEITEWGYLRTKNESLIKWWNSWEYEFSVWLDFSWDTEWNFVDVQQIKKQRVSGFPSFLMDWATRQIEEFVTKLTDFPTLFVVLPDFSWISDTNWWDHFSKWLPEAYNEWKQTEENRVANIASQIENINSAKLSLDCSGEDQIQCLSLDVEAWKLQVQTRDSLAAWSVWWAKKAFSWIRSVYDFLGNVPIVDVKPQKVDVEIPWIDVNTLNKTILDWNVSLPQYKAEFTEKINALRELLNTWSIDWTIDEAKKETIRTAIANLEREKDALVSDLDKNIQTLEEYREIPSQISNMFNKKEEWLGEILCSVESVSAMTSWWIDENGKRFKAWVELYVLIKAILKSWQLLIDVFQDYDAECHECKNERNDLLNYEFKLIDAIIPKLPIIRFPKWPDIVLDLHNIRAGLSVKVPDFNLTQRPMVLPSLPELTLPEFDASYDGSFDLDFEFPKMPMLTWPDIPELPNLIQGLPTVELPDLPPPPKLPEIFSSLKWILKVLKLVVKAMCILKSSPFVPEWRAWDQIALLTERSWYLPTDFLDVSLPEYSLPFVDSIKVTTWVNFQVDTDFMVEMAKQIVEPINTASSNVANEFSNAGLDSLDLDYSEYWESFDKTESDSETIDLSKADIENISIGMFTNMMAAWVINLFTYIEDEQDSTVSSQEFLQLVNESLADESITSNPRMKGIITLWENVNKMTYHKEEMLIQDLKKNSREKFEALSLILEKEIQKTKKLKSDFENATTPELFTKVAWEVKNNDFREYEKTLSKYNKNYLESAKRLLNNWEDAEVKSIREEWEKILSRVNGWLDLYKEWLISYNNYIETEKNLAAVTPVANATGEVNSCSASHSSDYSYDYTWLYIIEKDKSYRLFDYTDDLTGDEEYTSIDFDRDEDIDLLYIVNGQLYLKENISTQEEKLTSSQNVLEVRAEKNKFFTWEFVEAVNWFRETNTDNKSINISFNAPTKTSTEHFVYEYYTTVDRFSSEELLDYNPTWVSKNIIDAFVWWTQAIIEDVDMWITEMKNQATLNYVWNMTWINLTTFEMIKLNSDVETEISRGTSIYTSTNDVRILYTDSNNIEQERVIEKNTSLEFDNNIVISRIYAGDLYVKTSNLISVSWSQDISEYLGLPFFPESKIESIPDLRWSFNEQSSIEITYSSGKEPLGITFGATDSYEVYDLGQVSSDYLIRLDRENDFFYWKIHAVSNWITWTKTAQKLSSPQVEADTYAPELNYSETIRIPVYQFKTIDLTEAVYENSGFGSIDSVDIDFDLEIDSSWDWDPKNDNDVDWVELLPLSSWKLRVKFWEFDELIQKEIWITLTDDNGNVWFTQLDFEVYAPIPEIDSQVDNSIEWELDEDLIWEPVNLYRLRSGSIKQLENVWGSKIVDTQDNWAYSFDVTESWSWLTLRKSDSIIATLNEATWKITKKNLSLQILTATDVSDYPEIKILDESNLELYKQTIKLLENREVVIADDFDSIEDNWMYLRFIGTSNFGYYQIPTWVAHSAWSVVIHNQWDVTPLISLFPDWRIKGIDWQYWLKYKDLWDYIVLEIIDSNTNIIIAEVLYKINWSYLMK